MLSNQSTRAKRIVLSIVTSFALAVPAVAQDYAAPGGYLILGGLNAFETFTTNRAAFSDSMGFEIRGGYRLNPFLAFEVGGDFLSGFETSFASAATGRTESLTLDGGNVTLNTKVHLPWFGRLQPYGMFGFGGMWNRLRSTYSTGTVCGPGFNGFWWCDPTYTNFGDNGAFVMKFGGGTDFWITEDWALTMDANYVLPTGDAEDIQYVNLGWGVKFKF